MAMEFSNHLGVRSEQSFKPFLYRYVFQNELDNATASMVKLICTEKLNQHSSNLLQLFGGWGYMWEYEIAKIFAGARVMSIYGGTSEIMKELISRSIY